MKHIVTFLFISTLLINCKTAEIEEPEQLDFINELRLSTDNDNGRIDTDDISFAFTIIEGNGGYRATVSQNEFGDDNAKVIFDENNVTVEILAPWVTITITDSREKSKTLAIISYHESLLPTDYTIIVEKETTTNMHGISFGAGTYSAEKLQGNSCEVSIDENDNAIIKSLQPGNSYYKLKDHRGTTAKLTVIVPESHDMTGPSLEFSAGYDQLVYIILKYGNGGWKLSPQPDSSLIDFIKIHTLGDVNKEFDVVQINTTKDKSQLGSAFLTLIDKIGNRAHIILTVKNI